MAILLAAFLMLGGCAESPQAKGERAARSVPPGAVASLGDRHISQDCLLRALTHSTADTKSTLDKLVNLRAFGIFAEHGGLELGRLQAVTRSVLARSVLERIEAKARTPEIPSDEEVAAMTERRWVEFDRPDAARTCHAVVLNEGLEPAAGLALAQRLADELRQFTDCNGFIERAKAFPVAGANLQAEELPPVTPDGRTLVLDSKNAPVGEGMSFDPEFARAANQLRNVGSQTDITRTRFGWHIILLSARIEAKHVALEERRRLLRSDILLERARAEGERRIADLREHNSVSPERAAIEAIGRVQVDP